MRLKERKDVISNFFRERIVKAVIELIEEGCGITMEEVAKRSGLSKGSLYNYFSSKESLMDYIHSEMLAPMIATLKKIANSGKKPEEMLYDVFKGSFEIDRDACTYFKFLESFRTAEEEARDHRLMIDQLVVIVKAGIESGDFVKCDPFIIARTLFGIIMGYYEAIEWINADNAKVKELETDAMTLVKRLVIK